MYYFGSTYLLVIAGALLTLAAQWYVSHTFKKYSRVRSRLTGADTASYILQAKGYSDVSLAAVSGNLTDHYDPRRRVVRLSDTVRNKYSVAAVSVAAHECGHVCQHKEGYAPLSIRSALVPIANFGSNAGVWIVIASLFLGLSGEIAMIGVILFSFGVLFQLVTLPVEMNASSRALYMLRDYGILLNEKEYQIAKKVLRAAALTYLAAAASSVLQLLRLLILVGRRGD